MKSTILSSARWLLCTIFAVFLTANVWGETYSHSFTTGSNTLPFTSNAANTKTQTATLSELSWTITTTQAASFFAQTTGDGLQVGSKNNQSGNFTLSTSGLSSYTITKIEVVCKKATNSSAKLSVTIGSDNLGTQEQTLATSSTTLTFSNSTGFSGDVTLSFNNPTVSSKSTAVYIQSITITYSTGGSAEPAVSADPTSLDFGKKNIYDNDAAKSGSETIAITGTNLTGNITAALSGTNSNKFSLSATSFTPTNGEVEDDLTVSYSITEAGTYSATLTLSSEGADEVEVPISLKVINENIVSDELNQSVTGVTGSSYTDISDKSATSTAKYAGNCAGGNSSIQLHSSNNNSGIVSTTSGGTAKNVIVEWNSNTANGRVLNVYGSNTAYTEASELYSESTRGTLLGTITCGTSTELAIEGSYKYIGFRSDDGAMYLTSVTIDWVPPTKYAVTITNPAHGTISVANGNTAVSSGNTFISGTTLTVSGASNDVAYRFGSIVVKKTSDDSDVTASVLSGSTLTMPEYAITITASETALYAVSIAVNDNNMGSATINGGTSTIYVSDDDEITLVATPESGYEFANWTVSDDDIIVDDDDAGTTTALAGASGTITANFQAQGCTTLAAPTLDEVSTAYNSATIAWNVVANASEGYEVYVYNDSERTSTKASDLVTEETSFAVSNLDANTTYYYTVMAVGDGDDYCDENNPLLAGNFTTNDYPAATLTLSENGNEVTFAGSHKLNDVVTLPTTVDYACSGKVLAGWSTVAVEETDTKPASNYYDAGAEYTIRSTTDKLYAVYADAEGGESWNKVTSISEGDYLIVYEDGDLAFDGSLTTLDAVSNTIGLTISENVVTATTTDGKTLAGSCFTIAAVNNGYTIKSKSGYYIGQTSDKNGLASSATDTYTNTITFDNSGNANISSSAYLRYNQASNQTRFRYYKSSSYSSQEAIQLYKKSVNYTYSAYTTSCTAALPQVATPTFTVAAGTYTAAKSIEIECATAGATIYYTTDGTTPTNESDMYSEAIDLDECGTTTIKAIATKADYEDSEVASATYTINISVANTAATAYTPAEAIAIYDGSCPNKTTSTVYVKGVVTSASLSGTQYNVYVKEVGSDGSVTFEYYKMYKNENQDAFSDGDITIGDTIIAKGTLTKYNSTYEFTSGCYMVERHEYAAEKVDISNTKETAYTVAHAIELIDDVTSDLTKTVFVKGVVTSVDALTGNNEGNYTIKVKDAGAANSLTLYNGSIGEFDEITENDSIIATGTLLKYNSTYELAAGYSVVERKGYVAPPVAVTGVTLDEAVATIQIGRTLTLTATIAPADATNTNLSWESSNTAVATVSNAGVVTAVAEGSATITVTTEDGGFTATCTVTIELQNIWETTYTSNITLSPTGGTNATSSKVKFNADGDEYAAIKAGTGSNAGAVKITIPAKTEKLHLHAAAWNNETVSLSITAPNGITLSRSSIALTADAGVSGSSTTYTLGNDPTSQYFALTLTGVEEKAQLTFTATGGKRFVIYGVNEEGGIFEIDDDTDASDMPDNVNIEVKEGKTLTIDADKELAEVQVAEGATIEIAEGQTLTAETFRMSAAPGQDAKSGQLFNSQRLVVHGDLFLDVTLVAANEMSADYWYCLSAPFEVSVPNGIYLTNGTKLTMNTHYQIWSFAPDQYSNGGRGWKRCQTVMERGKAYLIGFDEAALSDLGVAVPNIISLKANATTFTADLSSMTTQEYNGSKRDYDWNGLANPNFHHTNIGVAGQYYDNHSHAFVEYDNTTTSFVVGTPLFCQYNGGSVSFTAADNDNYLAPARQSDEKYSFSVQIRRPDSRYFDNRIRVEAAEEATAEFEYGKDMETLNETCNGAALLWTNAYGKRLAVEHTPLVGNSANYELTLMTPAAGTYLLRQANEVEGAELYVTYNGNIVWNLSMGDYELDLSKGTTEGYGLRIVAQPNHIATGADELNTQSGNSVQKLLLNGQILILRDGQLYDITGKVAK